MAQRVADERKISIVNFDFRCGAKMRIGVKAPAPHCGQTHLNRALS
jgi:hypothetical protein